MFNLYIWVDDKNRNNLIRTIDRLARRRTDFKALLRVGDKIENTLNLLFPHGMPMKYLVSSLSIDDRPKENLDLAFRPVTGQGHPRSFPPGCSLVAKSRWKPCQIGPWNGGSATIAALWSTAGLTPLSNVSWLNLFT